MNFEDILSNQVSVGLLKKASRDPEALRHAYLLHGDKGVGKKTLAKIFSMALVCREEEKPCCRCVPCQKVEKGIHPDVMTVAKPEGKSFIPVEAIRELRDFVYIKPNEAEKKVVLIQNAEEMNLSASNALLKVLEEPPSYLVFILTSDNISLLPETIASRCVCLEMSELSSHQAEKYLVGKYSGVSPDLLEEAVLYGGGNLGRSIRYLEEESVQAGFRRVAEFMKAIGTSEYAAFALFADLERDREGFMAFLADLDVYIGGQISRVYLDLSGLDPAQTSISPLGFVRLHELILKAQSKLRANGAVGLTAAWFCRKASAALL